MAEVLNTRGHYLTQISAVLGAIKTNQEPLVAWGDAFGHPLLWQRDYQIAMIVVQ